VAIHTSIQCLTVVAKHFGVPAIAERIEQENALSGREPSQQELIRIASNLSLKAKFDQLSFKELLELTGVFPVLVKLDDGEYCIVAGLSKEAGREFIVVLDPRDPKALVKEMPFREFESIWSGKVTFLKRVYKLTDEDQPFGLLWFLPEIFKQKHSFKDIAITNFVLSILGLSTPIFTQLIIDKVLVHESKSTLWVLTIGIVVAIIFEIIFTYLRQYLLLDATNKIDMKLNRRTFAHLLSLPIEYFEKNTAGLVVRQVQQIQSVRAFLTGSMFFTILEIVSFVIFLPVLFLYSFKLTLIVMLIAILMGLVVLLLIKPFTVRLERLSNSESIRQGMLVESIHGIRTVKSLALEPIQRKTWDQRSANSVMLNFDVMKISLTAQVITQFLQRVMPIAIIFFGALDVFDKQLTVGALISFQMMSGRVVTPIVQFVGLIHEYQQTMISVRMLGGLMNHPGERHSTAGLRPQIRGHITFVDVSFKYPGSTFYALNKLNLEITPGQIIGIVGKSGSGKSTFTKLIQSLYQVQDGIIRFDGVDIRELDLNYLRKNIGVVLQENFIFRGTIKENISITKPDASFEEVVAVAQVAGADEFIEKLPQGYDTPLEENGTNLSGGQRQRLAIARAILNQPRVLIFDEASSALDPESEVIFMENLSKISRGRTVIIVSHRLSTLIHSDKIFFFENGKILDSAPHKQLLAQCKEYAHLWYQQNGRT
jgi:ATP-binding cassette, subfamily B, bacterial HlyB/CyaB